MLGPVIIDIKGAALTDEDRELLKHPMVGGVIFFAYNQEIPKDSKSGLTARQQLQQMIAEIRSINPDLIFQVDAEGPYVQRFKLDEEEALLPLAYTYGRVYDTVSPEAGLKFAKEMGIATVREQLEPYDIDVCLGPVLDTYQANSKIIAKYGRAFHKDPIISGKLASAYCDGVRSTGKKVVGKHFPDHGIIAEDSHVTKQPVCNISRKDLETRYAASIFKKLIKEEKLDAVMPAHIIYPDVDKNNTAGFSSIWLQDILRQEYGFNGTIISDCLSMEGANVGTPAERAKRALEAGCDMVIMASIDRADLLKALMTLTESYKASKGSQARIAALRTITNR